jgi:hypothetical protein
MRTLSVVLDEVLRERVVYVVEGEDAPKAAVIPYEDLLRLQRLKEQEQQSLERWDQLRAKQAELSEDWSEEEVDREVAAAIAEVRAERRAKSRFDAR